MFDVVVAIHTLEHLVSPTEALKRIHLILKPGGVLCGIVPNIDSFCSLKRKERWQWLDVNTHYIHFAPPTLKRTLESHGFELLGLYTTTGDYDQRELSLLLDEKEGRPLTTDELNEQLKQLWEAGRGEEIRFFAKAI